MSSLFKINGFINYLIVVFLNAFTDLGHKILIQNTVFKVYDGSIQIVLTAIVNSLILLPFVLTFSPAGFLSDRFAKNLIMKYSALLAVVITAFITLFYYLGWFYAAFFMTFLLALQSAIYSPAKYGYIKELLGDKYLSAGNGAVQAVTTVSILLGIIVYTVLFELFLSDDFITKSDVLVDIAPLGFLLVFGSVIEFLLASKLPKTDVPKTKKMFRFEKYIKGFYLFKNIKMLKRKKEIWENILALSIFWSISQVILAIFGEYAKSNMNITNAIYVQGVMALSGIGIVLGSIAASKISRFYINTGLAFVGALGIGIIVFSIPLVNVLWVIAVMFLFFGIFSGFILVPLNANIQHLSPNVHLGTILAGNNFIQNIFMISFLILTTVFAYFGMDAQMLFILMGFSAIYMCYMLLKRYFVISMWALFEVLASLRYKIVYNGVENISAKNGVLLLGNHVSWLDWLFLQIPIRKRINYLMDKEIYNWKILNPALKKAQVIPLSPKGFKDAMKEAVNRLQKGNIVALFPEGGIEKECVLEEFHKGFELILRQKDFNADIIAFKISGMQGSIFARCKAKKFHFPRREVKVCFYKPLLKEINAKNLKKYIESEKC